MAAISRRACLAAIGMAGLGAGIGTLPRWARAAPARLIRAERRVLEVNGKAVSVYAIVSADGRRGLTLAPSERFRVTLENRLDVPTLAHWHGQIPPNAQDGVPGVTQPALAPGARYDYDFAPRPGTHWMHSHVGLQRQKLLAAPLIVQTAEEARADVQEVVLFLHDFTFREPEEILAALQGGAAHGHAAHARGHVAYGHVAQVHGRMAPGPTHAGHGDAQAARGDHGDAGRAEPTTSEGHAGHAMAPPATPAMAMDLNDVEYDAFLANDRTLDDPEVVRVERGGRVRLRAVNAAASTNFLLDLGALSGELVAVDGNPVLPRTVRQVPLAMAQRADLVVRLPVEEGAWPVLALREGGTERCGVVLASRNGKVRRAPRSGDARTPALDARSEARLAAAASPPARPADRRVTLRLTGGMQPYAWHIDGRPWGEHAPVELRQDERVELTWRNETGMSHPMHTHGHHFQVVAVNGASFAGAIRDTVLVPAHGTVAAVFDAGGPGRWAVHCHNSYHMAAGMMTELQI